MYNQNGNSLESNKCRARGCAKIGDKISVKNIIKVRNEIYQAVRCKVLEIASHNTLLGFILSFLFTLESTLVSRSPYRKDHFDSTFYCQHLP